MDQQQLLATLIQLSDEQQSRIAELLERLEGQAQTLARASQRAEHAASALDRNGQKTALHLQAAVRESVETALHDTLTTLSQRAGRAFQDAGQPLLHTLTRVTKVAEETEDRLRRAVKNAPAHSPRGRCACRTRVGGHSTGHTFCTSHASPSPLRA